MDRFKLWKRAIDTKAGLRQCLEQASVRGGTPARKPTLDQLARSVQGVYKTLSDHIHSNKSPAEFQLSSDHVDIVEDKLSKRQCRALHCVCKAFGRPTQLKLPPDSDNDS